MKIGMTIRTFYPKSGGLQAHAETLVQELERLGHDVTIVTRSVSHSPSYHDYFFFSEPARTVEVNGCSVCVIGHSKYLNGLMWIISKCISRKPLFALGVWLFQLIFSRQTISAFDDVEVIHHVGQAHELIGFAAAHAAQTLKIPFLIQPTLHPGQWGDSIFDFHLYRYAQRFLVHTKFEHDFLRTHGFSTPIDVVGNGISDRLDGDGDRFCCRYQLTHPILLFLGRKSVDKGYFLLKQAFALVRKQRPDITLVCMGPSGNADANLSIDNGSIDNGILELGFGSEQEKHDALAACTALCVPSEAESFGLVYMEAGRYGKPLIGRKMPVLQELLGQSEAALLVGDQHHECLNPDALKEAILSILNHPERARNLGENAYRVSSQFLWSKVVLNFESAYFSICQKDDSVKNSLTKN